MSDYAIQVENLAKLYHIGAKKTYKTARETVMNVLSAPVRLGSKLLNKNAAADPATDLWALKDISFNVNRGEVIGIIGRNGAGKSTLLKVLSRITEPTSGRIKIHGRVGSLLEVGTGFHPELTGRENIFLNGAILGMRRTEIVRKFDEIVAFSEIEKFIDTPVKHYSSGMYMRLAFAVAAHLEPEILIIDEVLAVGDAQFQKKCLGKMKEVSGQGRTVLFVSHNMNAIASLCSSCVLLQNGQVKAMGASDRIIVEHMRNNTGTSAHRTWESSIAKGSPARFESVSVLDPEGNVSDIHEITNPITIELQYDVKADGTIVVPNFNLTTVDGVCAFAAVETVTPPRELRSAGRYVTKAIVPPNLLAEGEYVIHVALSRFDPLTVFAHETDAVGFRVVDPLDGTSARGEYTGSMPGVVRPKLNWVTTRIA